ncbi:putative G-protein coupled receptor 141 [Genypterus blacodes]|uniref:putative G-protein coupled receptor 141 n=1 Tax=Genypterus blacodes TaxID=154954 RepID=UPI003F761F9E
MDSAEITTMPPLNVSAASSLTPQPEDLTSYHNVLLSIYSVVLVTGTITLSFTVRTIMFTQKSFYSMAVTNLILTHALFLFTVPFRIYYYATNHWGMGAYWCKSISGMIHIHMIMSFIFYATILITRQLDFYRKTKSVEFIEMRHAVFVSAVMWLLGFVVVPCIINYYYGEKMTGSNNQTNINGTIEEQPKCFEFGNNIVGIAKILNYLMSLVFIAVTTVLTGLQANTLLKLYRKNRKGWRSDQAFRSERKHLCFALIMLITITPYHTFRLYYIEHLDLEIVNEVLLCLTTLNCLDTLTFIK